MIAVMLAYPNGRTREALLSGVPRPGDRVQLRNGVEAAALTVELITWIEADVGDVEPSVVVSVRSLPA